MGGEKLSETLEARRGGEGEAEELRSLFGESARRQLAQRLLLHPLRQKGVPTSLQPCQRPTRTAWIVATAQKEVILLDEWRYRRERQKRSLRLSASQESLPRFEEEDARIYAQLSLQSVQTRVA